MKITIEAENEQEKESITRTSWEGVDKFALVGQHVLHFHNFGIGEAAHLQALIQANMAADTVLAKISQQNEAARVAQMANGRGLRLHQ